ncbi:MAG: hypothetical protein WAP08_13205 [Smithellaceae bacterium]|jgi:hypothetical protein|nr:MAG: hypothetical protein BWY95_02405 [Bacteroidetes bacterium ADurb.BinA104]
MEERLLANALYQYLLELSEILKNRRAEHLSEAVQFASRFASGSTTELYAESRIILNKVLDEAENLLTVDEKRELKKKISGINSEFERIGGA